MKYSVLIPTFNRVDDLKICLSSVKCAIDLLPGDVKVEVLVSDNSSTDGSADFLRDFANSYWPVNSIFKFWINESNVGARENVKKLISEAIGDFFVFLTDDDIFLPQALVKLNDFLKKDAYSFIKIPNITTLIKSKKSYYYGPSEDIDDITLHGNFISIMSFTHILSGCVMRNSEEVKEIICNSDNVYPSTIMCAANAGQCASLSEGWIIHQWENEIFWDKDVDMSSDKSRALHTFQDQQLALLHVNENFFNDSELESLYKFLIDRHGFIIRPLVDKFGVPEGCSTVERKLT